MIIEKKNAWERNKLLIKKIYGEPCYNIIILMFIIQDSNSDHFLHNMKAHDFNIMSENM